MLEGCKTKQTIIYSQIRRELVWDISLLPKTGMGIVHKLSHNKNLNYYLLLINI